MKKNKTRGQKTILLGSLCINALKTGVEPEWFNIDKSSTYKELVGSLIVIC